jgi:hypothetical protein
MRMPSSFSLDPAEILPGPVAMGKSFLAAPQPGMQLSSQPAPAPSAPGMNL